jgi:iron(II)-dependent oxidoreductase
VGVFPESDTPNGLLDMMGNCYEWTSSAWGLQDEPCNFRYPYDPSDGRELTDTPIQMRRVLRGASWRDPRIGARMACRSNSAPDIQGFSFGLRLATSVMG